MLGGERRIEERMGPKKGKEEDNGDISIDQALPLPRSKTPIGRLRFAFFPFCV